MKQRTLAAVLVLVATVVLSLAACDDDTTVLDSSAPQDLAAPSQDAADAAPNAG